MLVGVRDMDDVTLPVPRDVPMVDDYPEEKSVYFVRDCYVDCYQKIVEAVQHGKEAINVTGTPGIGKSVFYLYVLKRFQEETDYNKIVTAAFEDRQQRSRKIWIKNENVYRTPTGQDEDGCILHLYDGVPPVRPEKGISMICFCSPKLAWLRRMRRKPTYYTELYLPCWTFNELGDANAAVGWVLDKETLLRRWNYFGGTARFTLGTEDSEKHGLSEFNGALGKVRTLEDVLDFFEKSDEEGNPDKVIRRLLHFDVKQMDEIPEIRPGTDYIAFRMKERLDKRLQDERSKLADWLDGHGKSAAFLAWLFENFAHERLLEGLKLKLCNLSTGESTDFVVSPTEGEYKRFSIAIPIAQALLEAYRTPEAQNLRSIDGYKIQEGVLWLFQMTRSMNHDVHTEGILDLLQHLRLLNDFKRGQLNVRLVFVVPRGLEAKFTKQVFDMADVYKSEKTDDEIAAMDCDKVPGIGPRKKRRLSHAGIRTISDLLTAYENTPSSVSSVRQYIEDFKTVQARRGELELIKSIPQFVAGLNYRPEDAMSSM